MRALLPRFLALIRLLAIIGDKNLKAVAEIGFCLLWTRCCLVGPSPVLLYGADPVNLTGRVLDPQGAAVPGAKVRLDNSPMPVGPRTTSDAHGSFTFAGVAPGNYILTAEASGFVTVSKNIAIVAGQRNEADLQFLKLTA
jgi:hypothetical protein